MDNLILEEIAHRFNFSDFLETLPIQKGDVNDFLSWINENSEQFALTEVGVEQRLNGKYTGNRCFGNSQLYSSDSESAYYEGFVRMGGRVIHHGFAVIDGQAIDVTRENRIAEDEQYWTVDSSYWGIKIPQELLSKYKDALNDDHYNQHMLVEMYYQNH